MAFPPKGGKFPPGSNMKTEKKEEKVKKDLDGDGEKGEPASHRAKVLGKKGGLKKTKKKK
jgi:hypothetical protein